MIAVSWKVVAYGVVICIVAWLQQLPVNGFGENYMVAVDRFGTYSRLMQSDSNSSDDDSLAPTQLPTYAPTSIPSYAPSSTPSSSPTFSPTSSPSRSPSLNPTISPSSSPFVSPTAAPSLSTEQPSMQPTVKISFPAEHPPTRPPSGLGNGDDATNGSPEDVPGPEEKTRKGLAVFLFVIVSAIAALIAIVYVKRAASNSEDQDSNPGSVARRRTSYLKNLELGVAVVASEPGLMRQTDPFSAKSRYRKKTEEGLVKPETLLSDGSATEPYNPFADPEATEKTLKPDFFKNDHDRKKAIKVSVLDEVTDEDTAPFNPFAENEELDSDSEDEIEESYNPFASSSPALVSKKRIPAEGSTKSKAYNPFSESDQI